MRLSGIQERAEAMDFSTAEIAKWCGVSLKSVNNWAAKNGVSKVGRYWKFTAEDVERICSYYDKEPLTVLNEPSGEDRNLNEEVRESTEEPKEEKNSCSETNEEPEDPKEEVNEVLREEIAFLQEQLKIKDEQIAKLIDASKALSTSTAMITAADKKEILLSDGKEKPMSRLQHLKAFFTGR